MKKNIFVVLFVVLLVCSVCSLSFAIQNGWWWNPAENGRGLTIEVQGDSLFLAWYAYDEATGEACWYTSGGKMVDAKNYTGILYRYKNGQCLTCPYVAPDAPIDSGHVTISFTDDWHGHLTALQGAVSIPIQWFNFPGEETYGKTNLLRGLWKFSETIGSMVFQDKILLFIEMRTQGDWFIGGVNEYGDAAVGAYMPSLGEWVVSDDDNFYAFQTNGNNLSGGCYHLIYSDGSLSKCYPLTGLKEQNRIIVSRVPQKKQDRLQKIFATDDPIEAMEATQKYLPYLSQIK